MAAYFEFKEEDMAVDESVGYPRSYAKLCRDRGAAGTYSHGPPFTFLPCALQQHEIQRAKELEQMFPIIHPKAKPTAKPKIFAGLLWKQLNHLGNAGFDPEVIRVDPYGNVLYFHADRASPLAWDIDHWFPCQRGGLTVPSNLRILQWQVCKRKHNKLEFLVPWWDLQLGISVNQFLSIFASSNSDFRHRAFSFFFSEGENEELNASQTVDSHSFPQHFIESKEQLGLAPAAIVVSRKESYDTSLALKSVDYNRQIRPHSPAIAARKVKPGDLKENENPDFVTNPYQAIVMARDSLKQREEAHKMQVEIQKLDDEVNEIRRKNDEEKLAIQDLELALIKRRRRAEKCRRLAEAQSSYRTMLEKMIRDAMHQSVIYKEQVRLNQAATNALMARLEAQKAICDSSEKDLHKKFKQRDEIEKQIRPEMEHARKRSRMDDILFEDRDHKAILYLPGNMPNTPTTHKELRVFLEEEQKASEAALSANEDGKHEEIEEKPKTPAKNIFRENPEEHNKSIIALDNYEIPIEHKLQALEIGEGKRDKIQFPVIRGDEIEEDEESRKLRGKGNVERWLKLLLEKSQDELEEPENSSGNGNSRADDIITKLNQVFPQKEARPGFDKEILTHAPDEKQQQVIQQKDKGKKKVEEIVEVEANKTLASVGIENNKSFEGKERALVRSESARTLRRIPSSPLLLGMRKKKSMVTGDDDCNGDYATRNSFIKSSIKTIKKAVKI
ncbi:uncharacterized protein LOC110613216 [Manihot esculenta]|uniref:Uncharacterized protein n=1 Tax=Manihot esculenta TaxID=3983 RepID=A0A2C9W3Y0_MANES|nr:uncharacterized protein LOC110613216 [Manihot esculenta]OAY52888.1 hypothetical protein MANES_04G119400v8 [Manihot esculenta]